MSKRNEAREIGRQNALTGQDQGDLKGYYYNALDTLAERKLGEFSEAMEEGFSEAAPNWLDEIFGNK